MGSIKAPVKVLERGDIYFFYRPKVREKKSRVEPEGNMSYAGGMEDIQHFFFILHPEGKQAHRMLIIGKKRLPKVAKRHEENWALVETVTQSGEALKEELAEKHYQTKTRGERLLPAARPSGEGVYAIVKHGDHTHLAYALELPEQTGEVQETLAIEPEASYILSVKNPTKPGIRTEHSPELPKKLQNKFDDRRFVAADPPDFLDYEGVELLLIGADTDPDEELGVELNPQQETADTAEIFKDLKLWKKEHTLVPLFKGQWR